MFEVGEKVLLNVPIAKPGDSQKFHCPWTGPYVVEARLSAVTYRIRREDGSFLVVHINRLKKTPVRSWFVDECSGEESEGQECLVEEANQKENRETPENVELTTWEVDEDEDERMDPRTGPRRREVEGDGVDKTVPYWMRGDVEAAREDSTTTSPRIVLGG